MLVLSDGLEIKLVRAGLFPDQETPKLFTSKDKVSQTVWQTLRLGEAGWSLQKDPAFTLLPGKSREFGFAGAT